MSWYQERVLLIADTIAFLQQAIGDGLVLAVKLKAPLSPEIVAAARYLRNYHEQRKSGDIDTLRAELRTVTDVFNAMQPALHRPPVRDDAVVVDHAADHDDPMWMQAA